MPRKAEEEEKPEDLRCTDCRKTVLHGQGHQREMKSRDERFCTKCWEKRVMETW